MTASDTDRALAYLLVRLTIGASCAVTRCPSRS
jgi:hypothetical protein